MCVYLLLLVHVITTTTIMISVLLLLLPYVGGHENAPDAVSQMIVMRPQHDILLAQPDIASGNEPHHVGIPPRRALETLQERPPRTVGGTGIESRLSEPRHDVGSRSGTLFGTGTPTEHPVRSQRKEIFFEIGTGFRRPLLRKRSHGKGE